MNTTQPIAVDLAASTHFEDGFPNTELLWESNNFRAVLFSLSPGQNLGRHSSHSDVLFVGVSGRGTIVVGDEEIPFGPSKAAHCPAEVFHDGKATGEAFSFLAVIAPRP